MKKHLLLILFMLSGLSIIAEAQKVYSKHGFSVKMPAEEWYLANEVEINADQHAVFFKHPALENEKGMKAIPNIAVLTEELPAPGIDIELYARHHKSTKRYNHISLVPTDEVYPAKLKNAIVYKGIYTDPRKHKHTVYIVYAVNGSYGLHFITDVNSGFFRYIKEDFLEAIENISTEKLQQD